MIRWSSGPASCAKACSTEVAIRKRHGGVDKLYNLIYEPEMLAYLVLNGRGVRGNEELAYVFEGVMVTKGNLNQQHP